MNEIFAQKGTEAATLVLEWLKGTEEFVLEQAPLLAQEIIYYGIASNAYLVLMWAVIIVLSFVAFKYCQRKCIILKKASSYPDIEEHYAGMFVAICTACSGVIGVVYGLYHLIGPLVTPKLYVMHQLSHLISRCN